MTGQFEQHEVKSLNDEKIVKAIKDGDDTAINQVIEKYSKLMWSIAGAVLKNIGATEDVEECVADVFIYLWKNPEKYDAGRGKLKAWLSAIARSQAIDRYRQLSKRTTVPFEDTPFMEQLGIVDGILTDEIKRLLITAVKALEEQEQEILMRRYYYEQKPKEIAVALDLPVKHVDNHLYRAKRKLRSKIADKEREGFVLSLIHI